VGAATDLEADLLPVRMLNEYVYCRRLFWLEYVAREFEHSHDTLDGARVHRTVDRAHGAVRDAEALPADGTTKSSRGVELASRELGITGIIDLLEERADGTAVPVDYKRGRIPPIPEQAYPPERIQVALQGMLLRANGFRSERGALYFAGSKARVDVLFSDALLADARDVIAGARTLLVSGTMPQPLVDSPKCPGCSLVGICLPDETNRLREERAGSVIRPLAPPGGERYPLYVLSAGASIGKSGGVLQVRREGSVAEEARLLDTSHISLFGNVQISTQALRSALDANIPVFYLSFGGWLYGESLPIDGHSLDARIRQFAVAADPDASLPIARAIVEGKLRNQRTMVRRALGGEATRALAELAFCINRARVAPNADALLGHEGYGAKLYFGCFQRMLKPGIAFDFDGRNRRPPLDPTNALLSFAYALLVRDCVAALHTVGLDPALGLFHRARPGRPSLALDLAEEFRPLIADSAVLSALNMGELDADDFIRRGIGVALTENGRKAFIGTYERRVATTVTHPRFGYSTTYRKVLSLQARLLARTLEGDVAEYPAFTTR